VVNHLPKYKVTIEIIDILGTGKCSMDQQVGDTFEYPEDRGQVVVCGGRKIS
jgi:uncharacterized repeat protein (TIGR04076 family)